MSQQAEITPNNTPVITPNNTPVTTPQVTPIIQRNNLNITPVQMPRIIIIPNTPIKHTQYIQLPEVTPVKFAGFK